MTSLPAGNKGRYPVGTARTAYRHASNEGVGAGEPGAWPSRSRAWLTAIVLSMCFTAAHIDRQIVSLFVVPLQRDLGINDSQFGVLQGFGFVIFYVIAGFPLGWLADQKNRRWVIVSAVAMWSVATTLSGFAGTFASLFILRSLMGAGEGGLPPASLSILADYFPPRRLALPVGLFVGGNYLGSGLAFVIGGVISSSAIFQTDGYMPLVGQLRGWQIAFLLTSVTGWILVPLTLFIREPERRGSLRNSDNDGRITHMSPLEGAKVFWRERRVYFSVMLGVSLLAMYLIGSLSWLPAYFIRVHHWTEARIGNIYGIGYVVFGLCGTLAGAVLEVALRRRGRHDGCILVCLLSGLLMIPGGILTGLSLSPTVVLSGIFVATFAVGAALTMAPTAIQIAAPNQLRGQATAVYAFLISVIGTGCGPVAIGFLTDHWFADPSAVGKSMACLAVVSGVAATMLFLWGSPAFRSHAREWDHSDPYLTRNTAVENS